MERGRPPRDPRGAAAVLLATIATMLSLGAFGPMLAPPIASGPLLWLPGLVGIAMAGIAWLRWPGWTVPVAGIGTFVLAAPSLGSPGLGWSPVGLYELWAQAVPEAQAATRPAEITEPIAALVAAIVALLVVIAAGFAHARMGLWAAVPALGLWAVPLASGLEPPVLVLLASLVVVLLVVAVGSRAELTVTSTVGALGVSVLAVSFAFVAGPSLVTAQPLALPVVDFGGSEPRAMSRDLDLRDAVSSESGSLALSYTSDDGAMDVLRLFTAEEFDGAAWSSEVSESDLSQPVGAGDSIWSDRAVADDSGASVTITVEQMVESRLPIVPAPSVLRSNVRAFYHWGPDELATYSATGASSGVSYSLEVFDAPISSEALWEAPAFDSASVPFTTIVVPEGVDDAALAAAVDAALASEGADPTSPYSAAVAFQNWLRDIDEFTYDDSVALAEDDAVAAFLEARRGYCTHFATTMAMMARSIGIPARLGVGFQGGMAVARGEYEVAWSEAHAWPELYFEGFGWVRFEPTPAVHTGLAPEYARDASSEEPTASPSPSAVPSTSPSAASEPTPSPSLDTSGEEVRTVVADAWSAWWWAVLLGLLAIGGAGVCAVRRASRVPSGAVAAWAWLMRGLPADVRPPANLPIRRARDAVVERSADAGRPLSPRMVRLLGALADAAEHEAFAPSDTEAPAVDAGGIATELLEELRAR